MQSGMWYLWTFILHVICI